MGFGLSSVWCLFPLLVSIILTALNLNVIYSGSISTLHEVGCAIFSGIILNRNRPKSGNKKWLLFLILSFGAVAIGDCAYGLVTYIFRIPPPRMYLPLVHEVPYVFFAWFLAGASVSRGINGIEKSEKFFIFIFLGGISVLYFTLSYFSVLAPYFSDHFKRPLIMYLCSTLYAVGQSISVAGIFLCSLRTISYFEFSFWLMFLILTGSDFALRYQDLGNTVSMLPIFEFGWEFSLAGIFIILVLITKNLKRKKIDELPSIQSFRFISAGLALGVLFLFVVISWLLTSYLRLSTGATVGTYVLGFVLIWSIANLVAIFLSKTLTLKVEKLSRSIVESVNKRGEFGSDGMQELRLGFSAMESLKRELVEALYRNVELETDARVGKLMSQVAHDIRSPLTALEVATSSVANLPEENRILIRSASVRIKDIANSLLKFRAKKDFDFILDGSGAPEHIAFLIDEVVSEKRIQFPDDRISLNFEITIEAYGAFATIERIDFKRVISNLIDNAIESITGIGEISITVKVVSDNISIEIEDSGRGIDESFIKTLLKSGGTHRKPDGSGLGFVHARDVLRKWNGTLSIPSSGNFGTMVRLVIPLSEVPNWFCEKISIEKIDTVIVVDDDSTVHQVWRKRFEYLDKPIKHFSGSKQLTSYLRNEASLGSFLKLVDYELSNETLNGLELVQNLGVIASSYLVTSHFENFEIRKKCQNLGLKIIPKSLVGIVPIV